MRTVAGSSGIGTAALAARTEQTLRAEANRSRSEHVKLNEQKRDDDQEQSRIVLPPRQPHESNE